MRLIPVTGSVEEFHARPIPPELVEPQAWWFEPTRPTLVLGSSQGESTANGSRATRARVDIVRRRSGGGAVWVEPGRCLWIDVLLPVTDPRWTTDIRESTYWLGAAWQRALSGLGIAAEVYRGGLEQTPWGRLVCFAALGPGEVLIDGRKAVGISQRRTRAGARFQCIAYDHWDPREVLDLLALSDADRELAKRDLASVAVGVGARLAELREAILDELLGDQSMH